MTSARFEDESLADALDRALRNAKHLRAQHAATVKAARLLARKIDAWDVIVDWAIEDAAETRGARPAVPANDNVSMASFLKYMDALGLTPDVAPARSAKPEPARPVERRDDLAAMRQRLQSGA